MKTVWQKVEAGKLTSMKRAAVVAVALLAVAAGAACGGEASFEERWAELGVDEAAFEFIGDFTPEQQAAIRLELKAAQVIYAEHFGAVTSDFTVYASTDLDLLNERLAADPDLLVRSTCDSATSRYVVVLVLEDCGNTVREHGGPLAYEYFRVLQTDTGFLRTADGRLNWLLEGSAQYASALVSEARGRIPLDVWREGLQITWAAPEGAFPGFLATDWLVERSGAEALTRFFRLGGHRAAFQSAFGMSVESFYDAFERHRQQVALPYVRKAAGTVASADRVAFVGAYVYAVVRLQGEPWVAGSGETDEQGAFEFAAPGSGYVIAVWLQCPRDDHTWGRWLYLGELGADGFVPDTDGFLEPDDEGAEPFTDGERDRTDMVIELPETRESLIAKHCEP